MATLRAGILGRVNGAVSNVVGASWKGINYIRERVTPRNPQTANQQANRNNFRTTVAWARTLITPVFAPFTDSEVRRKSGYNFAIGSAMLKLRGKNGMNQMRPTFDTRYYPTELMWVPEASPRITRGTLPNVSGLAHQTEVDGGLIYTNVPFTYTQPSNSVLSPNDWIVSVVSDPLGILSPDLAFNHPFPNSINAAGNECYISFYNHTGEGVSVANQQPTFAIGANAMQQKWNQRQWVHWHVFTVRSQNPADISTWTSISDSLWAFVPTNGVPYP